MALSAANLPEFASYAPSESSNEFKVRVAIDFGTDGIALAYAFGQTNEVTAHSQWAGKKFKPKFKPKTIILLDENHKVLAFGKDAKHMYMTAATKKDEWMLFERFKMALYDDDAPDIVHDDDDYKGLAGMHDNNKIAISDTLTATNGRTVQASVVFIAAFKHLQKEAKKYLTKNKLAKRLFLTLDDSEIQWIITVPAIWNDEAKYRMRQWAIEAGLVDSDIDDQCKIVYEPDCASLAIQYETNQDKSGISSFADDDQKGGDLTSNFKKGEKYILVDAGGGTTDIACHEILGENGKYGVKEILAPSGGPWGSCYIDDEYVKMLKQIFKSQWIDEFKKEQPNIYIELIDNFQRAKTDFYEDKSESNHNVQLPLDFVEFIESKLEENENYDNDSEEENVDIEDMVSLSNVFGKSNCVALSGEYLEINDIGWKMMFDHVLDPTIKHIKKLLNEPKLMRNCKYLCLAGGLSTSPYFQYKMREEFGPKSRYQLQLIIPKRPILCVVEGAAYFGITSNYIKARILKYSYGQRISDYIASAKRKGISAEYIEDNKFYDDYRNAWLVNNCLDIMAKKNQEIYVGQVVKSKVARWSPQHNNADVIIIVSTSDDPKISADGTTLGIVRVEFDNEDENDMNITLEFHFAETIIKAVLYRDKCPDKRQIRYITKYQ